MQTSRDPEAIDFWKIMTRTRNGQFTPVRDVPILKDGPKPYKGGFTPSEAELSRKHREWYGRHYGFPR